MKVSIVIPVYNTPKPYLKQCMKSIQNQTYDDFEVVIVDDGSGRETAAILDDVSVEDDRFRVFHCNNRGVSVARNYGMRQARGEFLTFIDADDFIEDNMLERMLELQEKHNADVVMCHHDRVVGDDRMAVPFVGQALKVCHRADIPMLQAMTLYTSAVEEKHVWHTIVCTCGKLYRRSMLEGIDFPTNVRNGEDAVFCFQAMKRLETMVVVNEPLYHYVQWEGSAAHGFRPETVGSWKHNREIMYEMLTDGDCDALVWHAYDMQALEQIKLLLFTVFAHPDNKGTMGTRELKEIALDNCYAPSIRRLTMSEQRDRKSKIVLWLLQHHCYGALIWLTRLRLKTIERT